jgi:signal transduction histidine kinase
MATARQPHGRRPTGPDESFLAPSSQLASMRLTAVPRMLTRALAGLAARMPGPGLLRRTVRLRLTGLYGSLFLVSGAGLLTITYLLVAGLPPDPKLWPDTPKSVPLHIREVFGPQRSGNVAVALAHQRTTELHDLLIRSGIALAIMAAMSIWLGWFMAGRVLRPLRTITASTRQISEENLHQRLALHGPSDELKELANTIDGLLGRLEGAFDAQRSFVANASHELRTPLAMMRTSLDVAEAKSPPISTDASVLAGKVREGLDQADRLVESFLTLARAHRGVMADLATVSLPEIATAALDTRSPALTGKGLVVRRHLDEAEVTGSETLLARMVENVIDNAVRHNQPAGVIDVTTQVQGPTARLIVDSAGPLLDHESVKHLGQPFRRLRPDRTASDNGVGLGLSIVATIATTHRGTLDLQPRPEGGLRVVIDLPRAAPPARNGVPG